MLLNKFGLEKEIEGCQNFCTEGPNGLKNFRLIFTSDMNLNLINLFQLQEILANFNQMRHVPAEKKMSSVYPGSTGNWKKKNYYCKSMTKY